MAHMCMGWALGLTFCGVASISMDCNGCCCCGSGRGGDDGGVSDIPTVRFVLLGTSVRSGRDVGLFSSDFGIRMDPSE